MPVELDTGMLVLIGLLLLFVTGVYVFVRKTILNFREGIEEGRR